MPQALDQCSLECLNPDVLLRILESVESKRDLAQLSATSRWLRTLCKPLMYSRFVRYVDQPLGRKSWLLPAFLWCYVRDLTIVDRCPDRIAGQEALRGGPNEHYGLIYARNPYLCGVLNDPKVLQVLRSLPNLASISLVMHSHDAIHGIPWTALEVILTLPPLRHFSAIGLLLSPSKSPSSHFDASRLAPLRSFCYEPHVSRKDAPFRPEEDILELLLATYHDTLEALSLPTEPTRIEDLTSWEWPRLRELRLRGQQWSAPTVPYTSLFSKMCRLRTLVLQISLPEGVEPRRCWDPRGTEAFPWPELEHLSLSHPSADDDIYTHLPRHVRILDLSCYPHLAERPWLHATVRKYGFPVPASSDMLGILRQCRAQPLIELRLEYRADERERELLQFVASAFPQLRTLQLYRYRALNDDFVEGNVVRLLAPLANLRSLKLHLDLVNTPAPRFVLPFGGWGAWEYDVHALDKYIHGLQNLAQQVARLLCPALTTIFFWSPGYEGRPVWIKFNVMRSVSAPVVVDPVVSRDNAVIHSDLLGLQTYYY